jgi:hypothetical protein
VEYKCYETIRKDLYRLLSANNLTIEWCFVSRESV